MLAVAASAAAHAGCSGGGEKTYPVSGVVTFEGKPLAGGSLVFEPLSPAPKTGKMYSARGKIGPEGQFRLSTFGDQDGAPPGRYRVGVTPRVKVWQSEEIREAPPQNSIPPNYTSPSSSGLEFEVKSERNEIDINLESSPA
ncbi:hypothetical protein Pla123a_43590 [Posidoniimonas polymericola]|uniref:Carboxypeptidase regulatory-like domain-containing protein n=2 Tax=Posidoniimonas polymericola TaxID=2528002 RepID=A0A5C5XVK8_9BACT|nr:hypothetical protein Pla123a_43590 [Posidoniimonas polymericola]